MTYVFTRGHEGSTFGHREEYSMDESWPSGWEPLKIFLQSYPSVHKMSWTYDNGTCWVVKRKDAS